MLQHNMWLQPHVATWHVIKDICCHMTCEYYPMSCDYSHMTCCCCQLDSTGFAGPPFCFSPQNAYLPSSPLGNFSSIYFPRTFLPPFMFSIDVYSNFSAFLLWTFYFSMILFGRSWILKSILEFVLFSSLGMLNRRGLARYGSGIGFVYSDVLLNSDETRVFLNKYAWVCDAAMHQWCVRLKPLSIIRVQYACVIRLRQMNETSVNTFQFRRINHQRKCVIIKSNSTEPNNTKVSSSIRLIKHQIICLQM